MAVDVADSRLALLPKSPSIVPVNPQRDNVQEKVREATRGRMADVVIELTGVAHLIPEEISLLRQQGTLGIVSGLRGKTHIDLHDLCNAPRIRIIGIHNGSHAPHESPADPWTKNATWNSSSTSWRTATWTCRG